MNCLEINKFPSYTMQPPETSIRCCALCVTSITKSLVLLLWLNGSLWIKTKQNRSQTKPNCEQLNESEVSQCTSKTVAATGGGTFTSIYRLRLRLRLQIAFHFSHSTSSQVKKNPSNSNHCSYIHGISIIALFRLVCHYSDIFRRIFTFMCSSTLDFGTMTEAIWLVDRCVCVWWNRVKYE